MSVYCLDTDIVSLIERGNTVVLRHLLQHDPSEVKITVITLHEQMRGRFQMIDKARGPQAVSRAYEQFAETFFSLRELPVLGFSESAIARFEGLLSMKLNVGKNDLRIAAIVLEAGGVLVTRNKRDFSRVPGLVMEDWSQAT